MSSCLMVLLSYSPIVGAVNAGVNHQTIRPSDYPTTLSEGGGRG